MEKMIAYCGIDCESCEARIATRNDDDALRARVASLWSELNGVEITPEMINCVGCRADGPKTIFCESICRIKPCAQGRALETCAGCGEMERCEKLAVITADNEAALRNLKSLQ